MDRFWIVTAHLNRHGYGSFGDTQSTLVDAANEWVEAHRWAEAQAWTDIRLVYVDTIAGTCRRDDAAALAEARSWWRARGEDDPEWVEDLELQTEAA